MCALDLLQEAGILRCRPADTPIKFNHKLNVDVGNPVGKERYQQLVGKSSYLSHIRPDITYAVSTVS